ncbi:YciI-like protein [Salegentibacter mishustinae]|uniref:YciI-like protein n=1 Tax=Salegentibacter mishustinae TaxID=270918 RepID=UPI001CE0BD1A|nr:YciI-like protein [Salegentibacter mishustinae]UBZ07482.1 YciI family protein [Salegentibacter mishustinae]
MNYYILDYITSDNYLEERVKYRKEHLNHATEYFNEGYLILGGAIDAANEAVLVFKADSDKIVEAFAQNDPYVKNGLIESWSVKKWNVVIGE